MAQSDTEVVELEGMVCATTVLKLASTDLVLVRAVLEDKLAQMPELKEAPLAVDLSELDGNEPGQEDESGQEPSGELAPVALESIVGVLRQVGLTPVAVRDPHPARWEEAARLGLGRLRGAPSTRRRRSRAERAESPAGPVRAKPAAQERAFRSLLVRHPIRGGQVVYARGADAVALAAVNPGGELVADGNIHVYGPLRGRALAGAHGDGEARIFCSCLEAELVSVAGVYLQADELAEEYRGKAAQVYLDGDRLTVCDL